MAREVAAIASDAVIVIKSTILVGFVDDQSSTLSTDNIIFSLEFLREGWAHCDNLHPSRIVVGERSERARVFVKLLKAAALDKDTSDLLTDPC